MSAHSFNRFYVVTKFILPTVEDLKLILKINVNIYKKAKDNILKKKNI